MCTGTIFNIQRFSIHDGPGIRTTVFFKGCPLRCRWCHNPEGLSPRPQLMYNGENCVGCGKCAKACPEGCHIFRDGVHLFDRSRCISCGQCAGECAFDALQACGYTARAEDVLATVLRDSEFYRQSGGGVTLSGGEPLMQPDFALELLRGAGRAGIHRAVETCGFAPEETVRRVLSEADLVLLDWKHSDPGLLEEYTGARLEVIRRTLETLSQMDKPLILRCPVIPGVNDTQEHFSAIAALGRQHRNIREIHVMAYHSLGSEKQTRLDGSRAQLFPVPEPDEVQAWVAAIAGYGAGVEVKKG